MLVEGEVSPEREQAVEAPYTCLVHKPHISMMEQFSLPPKICKILHESCRLYRWFSEGKEKRIR